MNLTIVLRVTIRYNAADIAFCVGKQLANNNPKSVAKTIF